MFIDIRSDGPILIVENLSSENSSSFKNIMGEQKEVIKQMFSLDKVNYKIALLLITFRNC